MRIWIYGASQWEVQTVAAREVTAQDKMIGASVQAEKGAAFPNGRLTPALQAAMRGEIDLLIVSSSTLSKCRNLGIREIEALFSPYHVSVKSFNSAGKSNS